ncbi:MerR family transcriptional regulator [Streptomyces sp. GMY02]|uniref:MerR family transcriptional regulator n=1 Tax=Streptomyces sp. GMY02 TaxID=1333528 RepID=UPI001C2C302B|nr:MerR family transcriptional regulator [Streptomyces sp. GMY02]QXE38465.1 MerR family transcriptional regulator [Streptomyces sp. GMY02]
MDGDTLYTIGALARRTGLTVKTIRFYSDTGIVPSTGRSPAGYRLYDISALARLDLVRTLRDLGLDLAVIRQVLDREISVPEVAAAHADALEVQIRTLRLRRAVLRAVAKRGSTPEEMDLMHKLAKLSDDERRRLVNDFIDDTFGGLDANPDFVDMMRTAMPGLPDDPEPEQVDAWVELAELTQDADFRAAVRRMAEYQANERAQGDTTGLHHDLTESVRDRVGHALDAGIDPASAEAAPNIDALTTRYAQVFGRADDTELRHWLLTRLEIANDPRAERYWHLLAVINGWPVPPSLAPVFAWFIEALRAGTEQ